MPKKKAIVRRTRRRTAANRVAQRKRGKLLVDKQVKNKTLSKRSNSAGLRVVKQKG
jgi:hypothetical protein